MPKAIELLRQGRGEELWQMCCGYLKLSIDEFMEIQHRLLLQQLDSLNHCQLGQKITRDARPKTVEEFRRSIPLTTFKDYCPELLEKKEEILPVKPELWVHSSGWSGEFEYKWVPMTPNFIQQLSRILYGVGILSSCRDWGDISQIPDTIKVLYSVAPRPYISGTFADILRLQTPLEYLPDLEKAESLSFEDRISTGFQQALSRGIDCFFGLSLVLVRVGEKLRETSGNIDVRPYLGKPQALWRLTSGFIKSLIARRSLLPKDIWKIRGIISSGVDSWVYKDKIKELWGRSPLDMYSCTEGGVIATQTWDYEGMTFIPDLNFLEFIPEEEHFKWQMDRSYQPKTLLLNEVKAGENYEIVITNFHGGALVRYRIGDMIRITSLHNDTLGIDIPQMAFERRVDDFLDFYVIRLTEKKIWQAIENTGIPYEDWVAYKNPGEQVLNIGLELKNYYQVDAENIATLIFEKLVNPDSQNSKAIAYDRMAEMADFKVQVDLLPRGTFARYLDERKATGADLAHLKPPHVNPSEKILASLLAETEETIVVSKTGVKTREKSPIAKVFTQ